MEIRFNAFRVEVNRLLEVKNSHVVVAHVLVDEPALNIDGLVLGQLLHNSGELFQSIAEI